MKADRIIKLVLGGTAKWARQRKAEERHASAFTRRYQAMVRTRKATIKDVAYEVMEQAYLKASGGGTLPALARQIMYAARPIIQEMTGELLSDQYFTQILLPDYIQEHGVVWNVVFDARGHFHEPHTEQGVPLGTIEVRRFLSAVENFKIEARDYKINQQQYPTIGPSNRYGEIVFIEKEGFMPLFEAAELSKLYDIAIMSTKGMSVTACRELVDTLCGSHKIPLIVFHDFDKSGFSIVGTLKRDTRRYTFGSNIEVIDAGLRLADIADLQSEASGIDSKSKSKAIANLEDNGATPEEIEFLLNWRVELNAFTSTELIAWIKGKLDHYGVKKIIPDDKILVDAYQRASECKVIQKAMEEKLAEMRKIMTPATVPGDLRAMVEKRLEAEPTLSWDEVVVRIAEKSAK